MVTKWNAARLIMGRTERIHGFFGKSLPELYSLFIRGLSHFGRGKSRAVRGRSHFKRAGWTGGVTGAGTCGGRPLSVRGVPLFPGDRPLFVRDVALSLRDVPHFSGDIALS